jgi:predicted dehydrogenase
LAARAKEKGGPVFLGLNNNIAAYPEGARAAPKAAPAGATHILLEKPGAPTVAELEAMAAEAKAAGVPVFMGFIKNIASYFTEALACANANPGSVVTLTSLNDYTAETLPECFERNAEGLLKNMAIHELALAATFFGMTADTVASVDTTGCDGDECDLQTLGDFTDFSKLNMLLTNKDGGQLRVVVDRCGGDGCSAAVTAADGSVLLEKEMVDEARAAAVAKRQEEHPDWIGYLVTQEVEYKELKERCAKAALAGEFPEGVASIEVAIEALKLAEYLTPLLMQRLAP